MDLAQYLPFEPTTEYVLGVIVGTVGVLIFCFASFNKPAEEYASSIYERTFLPKEQTGHIHYLIGFIVYSLLLVAGFLLVCALGPKPGHFLLSSIPGNSVAEETVVRYFPLYIALILVGIIPSYEKINLIERGLRKSIHKRASIPIALRTIVRYLERDPSDQALTQEVYDKVVPENLRTKLLLSHPNFQRKWRNYTFLMHQWANRDDNIQSFYDEEFLVRYTKITDQVDKDYSELENELIELMPILNKSNTMQTSSIYKNVDDAHERASYLIAGSIIQKCGLSRRRFSALEKLGYEQDSAPASGSITVLGVGLLLLCVLTATLIKLLSEPAIAKYLNMSEVGWPQDQTAAYFSVLLLMLRLSIIVAAAYMVFNQHVHVAEASQDGDGPEGFDIRLRSALKSILAASVICQLTVFIFFLNQAQENAIVYLQTWPFFVESVACGVMMYIALDFQQRVSPRTILASALLVGGLALVFGFFVSLFGYFAAAQFSPYAGYVGFYVIVALILGSAIGMMTFWIAQMEIKASEQGPASPEPTAIIKA